MKKQNRVFRTIFLMLLFCLSNLFSQKQVFKQINTDLDINNFVRCATVTSEKMISEQYIDKESESEFESWISNKIIESKAILKSGKTLEEEYTIPVVIHIIHNGDPVNTIGNVYGENISDAQAISQIDVLNQDFRMMSGTPGGTNSRSVAVDAKINFALAGIDPDGEVTTGIVRHNITPYTDDVSNITGGFSDDVKGDWENLLDVQNLKNQTQWDPTKYFNLWTVRMGGDAIADGGLNGLLGYAQLPNNSGLDGLNVNEGVASTDGVVIAYHSFGDNNQSDGSFAMNSTYNEGRTATHEVGHWLGLRHIWGDSNSCNNDDYCEDTPNATTAHYNCTSSFDTCTSDGLGNDMVENYMDYTNDTCMDTFTEDQKERMITVLNNSPRRVELLTSPTLSLPIVDFYLEPNPTSNTDIISIIGTVNGDVNISIYDATGKEVYINFYENVNFTSNEKLNINVGFLNKGVYFMSLQNDKFKVVKKFVVN